MSDRVLLDLLRAARHLAEAQETAVQPPQFCKPPPEQPQEPHQEPDRRADGEHGVRMLTT